MVNMLRIVRKVVILIFFISLTYASDNQLFKNMDNQVAIGYEYSQINTYNPNWTPIQQTTTMSSANIYLEQLFDSNVWGSINGNFIFDANRSGNQVSTLNSINALAIPASLTGKAGYSFNFPSLKFQVIPYLTTGVVLNYNGVTLPFNGFPNSYYVLYGGGGRLEYVVLPNLSLFFDQTIGYLSDQGGNMANLSAMEYNSALGIRYNVTNRFQIGLQGQFSQISLTDQSVGYVPDYRLYRNDNQTGYGGLISFAYLYDAKSVDPLDWPVYNSPQLAHFDNSYNVGYSFSNINNSYSNGEPAITGNLNQLNVQFSHVFDTNIWVNLDGSITTGITQSNLPTGQVSDKTPIFVGFPGDASVDLGYALTFPITNMQLIPYINGGVVGDINAYNIKQNFDLDYVLTHDIYLQYGAGLRFEYSPANIWLLSLDQSFYGLQDRSSMNANAWQSKTDIGTKLNITKNVMIGLDGFYDIIRPTGQVYNPSAGTNYALIQDNLGGMISVGVNY